MTTFGRVKEILDKAIAAWKQQHGRDPNLAIHGSTFGWQTKQQLANAKAFGKRLIDPAKVGNGQGTQTNLVIALKTGVPPFARMPAGGPFVPDAQIQEIVQWIDANMPDTVASTSIQLKAKRVASGFQRPVFATTPSGDTKRLFVVEQHSGLIRILQLSSGQINPAPFLKVPGISTANEQGLLGLAFHPKYATNGLLFVNLTRKVGSNVFSEIRRYKVSAGNPDLADAASAKAVLTIPQPAFPNHKCGWLAFGPKDRLLYIGTGDGGDANDPGQRAQNLGELLGKMLRIDVDGDDFPNDTNRNYKIPPSNPFMNRAGARGEIWAFGLRNPWRNSFDRQTGDLYIADVGQEQTEEIDFQPAASHGGENYGWRAKEGSVKNPSPTVHDPIPAGVTDPIHEYHHDEGSAIVGGYVYRGTKIANLAGTYFFADMTGAVWSFRFDGTTKKEFIQRTAELLPNGPTIALSAFGEDGSGELYFLDLNGDVFQIVSAT